MLISEARKFIFIAVPKTGTTAVESHLMSLDPTLRRNELPGPDGTWVSVHKHVRAAEVKELLGTRMEDYTVVAFIRDPVSSVVSKYRYYKFGRGAQRARKWKFTKHIMQTRLRVLSTFVLPLRAWARFYPYSMTYEFLLDDNKNLLVDLLGDFGDLQTEFERIFVRFGFEPSELKLPLINRTESQESQHQNDQKLAEIVAKKANIDLELFNTHVKCDKA